MGRRRKSPTPFSSTTTVSCSRLPTFQFLKPTQRCMLISLRWEEGGDYLGACCGLVCAFRLHAYQITLIHSPQHPRITLHVPCGSALSTTADLTACVLQNTPGHLAHYSLVSRLHSSHFPSFSSRFPIFKFTSSYLFVI